MRMLTTFITVAIQTTIVSCLVARLVVSPLLSTTHAHRTLAKRWRMMPLATIYLWSSFLGAWLFVVAVDVLQHGNHLAESGPCLASYFVCSTLYILAKMGIFLFLTERAHIVHGGRRRDDKLYILNMFLSIGVVVFWFMAQFVRVVIRREGKCFIAITRSIDIPFIVYDFLLNGFLTIQFLVPLLKLSSGESKLRGLFVRVDGSNMPCAKSRVNQELSLLAKRTAIAALLCSVVTTINLTQVAILEGREESWICLTTCSVDTVLNCIILHFTTNGRKGTDESLHMAEKGHGMSDFSSDMQDSMVNTPKPVVYNSTARDIEASEVPEHGP